MPASILGANFLFHISESSALDGFSVSELAADASVVSALVLITDPLPLDW